MISKIFQDYILFITTAYVEVGFASVFVGGLIMLGCMVLFPDIATHNEGLYGRKTVMFIYTGMGFLTINFLFFLKITWEVMRQP